MTASRPRCCARSRVFAIEIVYESLRQIECGNRRQNSRLNFTRVERHRDSALGCKLVQGRADLSGDRSEDLFVSLADILVQTIFLRLTLSCEALALLLLGLNGFLIIRARLELRLNRFGCVDIAPNSVFLVAEHRGINQGNPAVRHRGVTRHRRRRRSGRRRGGRSGGASLWPRLARNRDSHQRECGVNQEQSVHNFSCLVLTDFLSTDYTDFTAKDKAGISADAGRDPNRAYDHESNLRSQRISNRWRDVGFKPARLPKIYIKAIPSGRYANHPSSLSRSLPQICPWNVCSHLLRYIHLVFRIGKWKD